MQFDLTPTHVVSVSAADNQKFIMCVYMCVWVKKRRVALAFRLAAAERQFESFNRDARGLEFQGQCCK